MALLKLQILTYTDDLRTERIKIFIIAVKFIKLKKPFGLHSLYRTISALEGLSLQARDHINANAWHIFNKTHLMKDNMIHHNKEISFQILDLSIF